MMDKRILETANEYKRVAYLVEESAIEDSFDTTVPDYVTGALTRLYYAAALKEKLEKCQDLLSEETDQETANAVIEADDAIESATNKVFEKIEEFAEMDFDFAQRIEKTTVNESSEDEFDLLCQLFKCEGILRMAYRTARVYPVYGNYRSTLEKLDGMQNETPASPEDTILRDTGIDVYALLSVRERLIQKLDGKITQQP